MVEYVAVQISRWGLRLKPSGYIECGQVVKVLLQLSLNFRQNKHSWLDVIAAYSSAWIRMKRSHLLSNAIFSLAFFLSFFPFLKKLFFFSTMKYGRWTSPEATSKQRLPFPVSWCKTLSARSLIWREAESPFLGFSLCVSPEPSVYRNKTGAQAIRRLVLSCLHKSCSKFFTCLFVHLLPYLPALIVTTSGVSWPVCRMFVYLHVSSRETIILLVCLSSVTCSW